MDKKALRRAISARKRMMTTEEIDEKSCRLAQLFLSSQQYINAKTIYGYLPYNQEVRTFPILERALHDGKTVAVPKVYGEQMHFICLQDLTKVAAGFAGIPEPVEDGPIANDPHALVLMPGLAFDRQGHRMGYGGGYYDKFLANEPEHPTVALCYDFQVLEHLETDDHDIPVDCVLWA